MTQNPMLDRPSRWLIPLIPVALGGVILVAEATDGEVAGGLAWFAVLAAVGALLAFGGRFQAVRDARGDDEDERDAMIASRAMAAAGLAMILVLTGAIVFELARGEDPSPYTYVIAVGGAVYAVALLALRRYS
jgi:drug/metabolite transporter (DMT)-like permease